MRSIIAVHARMRRMSGTAHDARAVREMHVNARSLATDRTNRPAGEGVPPKDRSPRIFDLPLIFRAFSTT